MEDLEGRMEGKGGWEVRGRGGWRRRWGGEEEVRWGGVGGSCPGTGWRGGESRREGTKRMGWVRGGVG